MTLDETLHVLEAAGSEQTRKTYRRHGASENLFGVSFAVLGKLTKKIKRDHALAVGLWDTGNEDARFLAMMIADPAAFSSKELDAWVASIEWYCPADLFARYVASKSPLAAKKGEVWRKSKVDYTSQVGWDLVTFQAMDDASLPDEYFAQKLVEIEKAIAKAQNRTRHAMNGALIGIGGRNAALRKLALAAAARIGKVHVDHGDTNCKTPDAASYIQKIVERKKAQVQKKAARA